MPKWWWERWRRGGKRLRRDEPRAHRAMVEAEPELTHESERWREEERRKQEKKS
jgi:hypothetical protein